MELAQRLRKHKEYAALMFRQQRIGQRARLDRWQMRSIYYRFLGAYVAHDFLKYHPGVSMEESYFV